MWPTTAVLRRQPSLCSQRQIWGTTRGSAAFAQLLIVAPHDKSARQTCPMKNCTRNLHPETRTLEICKGNLQGKICTGHLPTVECPISPPSPPTPPEFSDDGATWGDDAKRDSRGSSRHAREWPGRRAVKKRNFCRLNVCLGMLYRNGVVDEQSKKEISVG